MEDTCCSVCMNQFHESEAVPKLLDCSHTFCANCVQQLCESSKQCPICRKEMTKTEYPTSLIVLKFVDNFNESSHRATLSGSSLKYTAEIKELKLRVTKKLEKLNQESKELDKKILSLNDQLRLLDQLEERLGDFDAGETMKLIIEVKDDLSDELDLVEEVGQAGPVILKKENFQDGDSFKREVVRLVREEIVFWFKDVDEQTVYGKLTLEDKYLVCHSLSHLRIGIGQGVTLVRVQDLVPSHYDGIDSFLVLAVEPAGPQITLKVRLRPLEPWTPPFAHLCTGERGPSFKGAAVVDGRGANLGYSTHLFSLENYLDNGREKKGVIETIFGGGVKIPVVCEPGEVVLKASNNGSFVLTKITKRASFDSLVGVVTYPSVSDESFVRGSHVRARDCGICVPI